MSTRADISDEMSMQGVTEAEALRAYFESHMNMQHAISEEVFAKWYVRANLARDRLIRIEQERHEVEAVRIGLEEAQERGLFDATDECEGRGGGLWDE